MKEKDSKNKIMKINVTGRHIHITEALQLHIENKFKKIEKHFENIIDIHVILTVEKIRMEAEATLKINKGNIFANSEKKDMYMAIDELVDKLDRQLKKQKEKKISHRRDE
jgi:putative sigma-54 modulation protein